MSSFTVDPASLEVLAATLGQLCAQMESMPAVASGYQGLLGGRDLESEVEHFSSHWHYGLGQLEQHMRHVVANLQNASATYATSDAHVAQACGTGGRSG